MKKKIINIFLILAMLISIFSITIVNAGSVGRIGSSKVKSMVIAYTGGNSQVYANKITKQDGTVVRYVYSSNFIVTPDTIAKLKSVLGSEYSSLIPDDYTRDDNVGIKICSDSSLIESMDENWKSSEWVARNVVAIREIKNVTNEDGDGINQTAIFNAQSHTVLFNEMKNNAENGNRSNWEESELAKKEAWDEAEAAHHESDSTYIPQEYVGSEYVPLDFNELTASDIENTKTLEENQIEIPVGTNLTKSYEFINQKLEEVIIVESVNHVASIYSSHTIIDDSETTSANEDPDDPKIVEYTILEGADQTYTEGENLVVKASGDLDKLQMLKVDGTELSKEKYTLEPGSTIAILKSSYLSTIDVGIHTLTFVYNDGSVDTTFTISTTKNVINNPQTGDTIVLYIGLGLISLIGFAGSTLYLKKKGKLEIQKN